MFSTPLNGAVFGVWPMATKTHFDSSSRSAPVFRSRSFTARISPSASVRYSAIVLFQTGSIFGFASVRSAMIFEARSESRRWMR